MTIFKRSKRKSKSSDTWPQKGTATDDWAEEPAMHDENGQNKWWEHGSNSSKPGLESKENSVNGSKRGSWWETEDEADSSANWTGDGSKPKRRVPPASKEKQPRRQSLAEKLNAPVERQVAMDNRKRQKQLEEEFKLKQEARKARISHVQRQWEEHRGYKVEDPPEESSRFSCCSSLLLCSCW